MARKMRGRHRGAEKIKPLEVESWAPKTELGRMVKNKEVTTFEQIRDLGKPVLEPEIIDALLSELESETLSISVTQRTTDSGRKISFRVVTVLGDRSGHVGIGVGKSEEVKPAIDASLLDARKNMVSANMGCGSWECKCGQPHSMPQRIEGKYGSTQVVLKPAPKGLGLAANDVVKKVLGMAGVKDVWSTTTGGTSNVYNMAMATIAALDSLNTKKPQPGEKI